MTIKLGVVMDPIESINPHKDSTLAMLLAAQKRNWQLHYMQASDLYLKNGLCHAHMRTLQVEDNPHQWFSWQSTHDLALHALDIVLMRVDPPVDQNYLYTTHLLALAETEGLLVINKPASLRDINEKLFISRFADYCAPTLVSQNAVQIMDFLQVQQDIVIKPLDGMGGHSVFRVRAGDQNTNVIIETVTHKGHRPAMVQRYIKEIEQGDKRILMIDGEAFPQALARIPAAGEHRGNLAAGGRGEGQPLSARDREICAAVGPVLKDMGVLFAGLDVIGDYLTEINVTSPTCIRELDKRYQTDIAGLLLDKAITYL